MKIVWPRSCWRLERTAAYTSAPVTSNWERTCKILMRIRESESRPVNIKNRDDLELYRSEKQRRRKMLRGKTGTGVRHMQGIGGAQLDKLSLRRQKSIA